MRDRDTRYSNRKYRDSRDKRCSDIETRETDIVVTKEERETVDTDTVDTDTLKIETDAATEETEAVETDTVEKKTL